jgi:two-component SAPR family response regulator
MKLTPFGAIFVEQNLNEDIRLMKPVRRENLLRAVNKALS